MKIRGTKNIWIKSLAFLVGAVVLLCIGYPVLTSVVKNKIAQSLQELSPKIRSSYAAIHVNLLASSVSVDSLQLSLIPNSSFPKQQHSIYFPKVTLSGIHFADVIFSRRLFINEVTLEKAEVKLDQRLLDKKESAQLAGLDSIKLPFKNIVIKNVRLSQTSVWLREGAVEKPLLKGDMTIYDQQIISDSFHMGSFDCELSNIHYALPGRYHSLQVSKISINSRKETLQIDSIKIIPALGKLEIGKKIGRQVDWVEGFVAKIEIANLKVSDLINKKLVADQLTLHNCNIHFFRDRKLPRQQVDQPMLNGYLERIPFDIRIETFKIKNASVVSEEMPKEGSQTGYLKITHINLSMSPLRNHEGKSATGYSDTYIEGSIMNAGSIQAHIRAPLKENVYTIKGTIKDLDLSKLNPSAENLGKFHVESGILNFLDFHFVATEEKAEGEIIGEYHNLVMEKLKIKNGEKKVAVIPTFFLKHMIIPKNKDKSLDVAKRTGKIDYKRDPTRIVSFYFLKSLLDGIRNSFDLGFLLPK